MIEENYNYRTSQIMLRNQFPGSGKLKIPTIPKFQSNPGDFDDLLLIGFDKTNIEDQNHLNRMVHFFLYDYKFERVWKILMQTSKSCPATARYYLPISVCIWRWLRSCSSTTPSETVGAAHTGPRKESASFLP